MQLLIVDDEVILVDELRTALDWDELGVEGILTAHNIRQAKDIFTCQSIDLMLCDIEMPQGSGLELLAWVKEHSPHTEVVILTCHADFSFAKEAIRLGSMEYLLKPVPYKELEQIVIKAFDRIRSQSHLEEVGRYGEYWFKQQPMMMERFWEDVLNRTIASTPNSLKEASELRNIPYSNEMLFIPVLFSIRRWNSELSKRDQKIMEYAVRNIILEVLLQNERNGQIIALGLGELLVIISGDRDMSIEHVVLLDKCEQIIRGIHHYLRCDLNGYMGTAVLAHELANIVDQLLARERNNVLFDNRFFTGEDEGEMIEIPVYSVKDMEMWSIMLSHGETDNLIQDINRYLDQTLFEAVTADMLQSFYHDFMQMIYSTMKKEGIHAHQLLKEHEAVTLNDKANSSIKDLKTWIHSVISYVTRCIADKKKYQTVVKRVEAYISMTVEQDVNREDIAAHFFVNPDYLDRLFKKETGLSVTRFIVHARLVRAQELLVKTEMQISEIASLLGYKNMSHFSVAFKKFTTLNPAEFRKNHSVS